MLDLLVRKATTDSGTEEKPFIRKISQMAADFNSICEICVICGSSPFHFVVARRASRSWPSRRTASECGGTTAACSGGCGVGGEAGTGVGAAAGAAAAGAGGTCSIVMTYSVSVSKGCVARRCRFSLPARPLIGEHAGRLLAGRRRQQRGVKAHHAAVVDLVGGNAQHSNRRRSFFSPAGSCRVLISSERDATR